MEKSEKHYTQLAEGRLHRRLTINLTHELHKKLKQAALDADCTATNIVEKMLLAKLG